MIGRIVRSVDFERVLRSPMCARSAHFAVHYVRACPSRPSKGALAAVVPELSTGEAPQWRKPVDESAPDACWLGAVVPKRHARRAVTRSLLKRQIRQAASGQALHAQLPSGLWVVRLRAPFDRTLYPSAASSPLRCDAGAELADVLAKAAQRVAAA